MELKAKEGCCEDASPMSNEFYIPCNKPAVMNVQFASGEGPYRMCEVCGWHAVKNRGAKEV